MTAGPVQDFSFSGASPLIRVAIIVQNTNALGFTVQSMAGNVFADDSGNETLVGNIYNFTPFSVPGNSQSTFILNLKLFPVGIVNTILEAVQYKNFTKSLTVDATVNIDGIQFAKTLVFNVGL